MTVPVSAIVTAYARIDDVLNTLRIVSECVPRPAEILVHVDSGQQRCAAAISQAFPAARVLISAEQVGPGGGRNKLVAAAAHPIVASFDDDSYPVDRDYFARLVALFDQYPDAWVIDAHVFHRHQPIVPDAPTAAWVADFSGGACAYRRDRFLRTGGYVPLPVAYGMEEVDVGLRVHALGGRILRSRSLRVFHNTDLARHADPEVTAASIVNIALLTYLRYPVGLWAVGAGQCLNRVQWLLRHGRRQGVWRGLSGIPSAIRTHRRERRPLTTAAVRSFLALRRSPRPV